MGPLEIAAIKVAITDYDDSGAPVHLCSKCPKTESIKRILGCGFDPDHKGKSKHTQEAGLHGVCPGWYREQPLFIDIQRYLRLKDQVTLNQNTPRRVWDLYYWADIFEAVKIQGDKNAKS